MSAARPPVIVLEVNETLLDPAHPDASAKAAFVTRPGNAVLDVPGVPRPDIVAPDPGAVADAIIRLSGRS